jgi:hypothetical protein
MSKTSTALQTEVKHCWAYGKFAVDLLQQVSKDHNLDFESVWTKYFPDVSHEKALKNGRNFIKNCDPRKAISSHRNDYQYYLSEQSEKIQSEGKTFNIQTHGKEIGSAWKKLTDAQKEKYKMQAMADKARYDKELAEVEEKIRSGSMQESPFHRASRHRTGNVSALNMYVSHMTTTLKNSEPDLTNTDRMKKIHEMWKSASAEEKATYQVKADEQNKANSASNATGSAPATSSDAQPVAKKSKPSPKPKAKSVATATPVVDSTSAPATKASKPSPKSTTKAPKAPKTTPVESTEVKETPAPAPVATPSAKKSSPKPKVAKN